jgi:hypothetical protein
VSGAEDEPPTHAMVSRFFRPKLSGAQQNEVDKTNRDHWKILDSTGIGNAVRHGVSRIECKVKVVEGGRVAEDQGQEAT